jgi:hypothetical protein
MCASYTVGLIQEQHPLNLSFDTYSDVYVPLLLKMTFLYM